MPVATKTQSATNTKLALATAALLIASGLAFIAVPAANQSRIASFTYIVDKACVDGVSGIIVQCKKPKVAHLITDRCVNTKKELLVDAETVCRVKVGRSGQTSGSSQHVGSQQRGQIGSFVRVSSLEEDLGPCVSDEDCESGNCTGLPGGLQACCPQGQCGIRPAVESRQPYCAQAGSRWRDVELGIGDHMCSNTGEWVAIAEEGGEDIAESDSPEEPGAQQDQLEEGSAQEPPASPQVGPQGDEVVEGSVQPAEGLCTQEDLRQDPVPVHCHNTCVDSDDQNLRSVCLDDSGRALSIAEGERGCGDNFLISNYESFFTPGSVTVTDANGGVVHQFQDQCFRGQLVEYYCDPESGSQYQYRLVECPCGSRQACAQ